MTIPVPRPHPQESSVVTRRRELLDWYHQNPGLHRATEASAATGQAQTNSLALWRAGLLTRVEVPVKGRKVPIVYYGADVEEVFVVEPPE